MTDRKLYICTKYIYINSFKRIIYIYTICCCVFFVCGCLFIEKIFVQCIYICIYNRSVSIIEYKMEQTYIHMYMCMRLKTIMKPCLYIYTNVYFFLQYLPLWTSCRWQIPKSRKLDFFLSILMPLYYCVVAMINKFNKYIYIYKIIIIKVVIIVIINIIE